MKQKKMIFVFNPRSGKGLIRMYLVQILDLFVKHDYMVTVYPTQAREDAQNKIPMFAEEYDYLVCCGGDGTLDEVVTGMMNSQRKIPIGYIPAGSTNDFASTLHIPTKNMLEAAEIAMTGEQYPCDVGQFNGTYFIYVAAFGLFTDVSYQTNQNMKNVLGHLAYILEGAKRLYDIPSYMLRIEANGKTIAGDFVYCMISNSVSVGGMRNMIGSEVKLDDGLFEVTLIQMPKNPLMLNDILTSLLMSRPMNSRYIYTFKTNHIEFHSEDYVPWTLDGEFGGNHKTAIIDNRQSQVTFVAPPEGYVEREISAAKRRNES